VEHEDQVVQWDRVQLDEWHRDAREERLGVRGVRHSSEHVALEGVDPHPGGASPLEHVDDHGRLSLLDFYEERFEGALRVEGGVDEIGSLEYADALFPPQRALLDESSQTTNPRV
jgi:hypothetical protein